jgi:hypothetical protein
LLGQIVRVVVRVSVGVVLGAVPGALYAGLVGAVHLGVYGRWDRVPAFAVGSVLVGALLGCWAGIAWALSGEAAPIGVNCRPPTGGYGTRRVRTDPGADRRQRRLLGGGDGEARPVARIVGRDLGP